MPDWHTIVAIDPLGWQELFTALCCGFIIGLERQLRGKPAGIRTTRRQRDSQSVLPLTLSRPATSRLLVLQRAGSSFPAGS